MAVEAYEIIGRPEVLPDVSSEQRGVIVPFPTPPQETPVDSPPAPFRFFETEVEEDAYWTRIGETYFTDSVIPDDPDDPKLFGHMRPNSELRRGQIGNIHRDFVNDSIREHDRLLAERNERMLRSGDPDVHAYLRERTPTTPQTQHTEGIIVFLANDNKTITPDIPTPFLTAFAADE